MPTLVKKQQQSLLCSCHKCFINCPMVNISATFEMKKLAFRPSCSGYANTASGVWAKLKQTHRWNWNKLFLNVLFLCHLNWALIRASLEQATQLCSRLCRRTYGSRWSSVVTGEACYMVGGWGWGGGAPCHAEHFHAKLSTNQHISQPTCPPSPTNGLALSTCLSVNQPIRPQSEDTAEEAAAQNDGGTSGKILRLDHSSQMWLLLYLLWYVSQNALWQPPEHKFTSRAFYFESSASANLNHN